MHPGCDVIAFQDHKDVVVASTCIDVRAKNYLIVVNTPTILEIYITVSISHI